MCPGCHDNTQSRERLLLLIVVRFSDQVGKCAPNTVGIATVMLVSVPKEVVAEDGVMQESLQDSVHVAGLPHIEYAPDPLSCTGALGRVVLDVSHIFGCAFVSRPFHTC